MDPKDVREYLREAEATKKMLVNRGVHLMVEIIEIVRLFGLLQGLYARLERDRRP
jgi:hypothetical protein